MVAVGQYIQRLRSTCWITGLKTRIKITGLKNWCLCRFDGRLILIIGRFLWATTKFRTGSKTRQYLLVLTTFSLVVRVFTASGCPEPNFHQERVSLHESSQQVLEFGKTAAPDVVLQLRTNYELPKPVDFSLLSGKKNVCAELCAFSCAVGDINSANHLRASPKRLWLLHRSLLR